MINKDLEKSLKDNTLKLEYYYNHFRTLDGMAFFYNRVTKEILTEIFNSTDLLADVPLLKEYYDKFTETFNYYYNEASWNAVSNGLITKPNPKVERIW